MTPKRTLERLQNDPNDPTGQGPAWGLPWGLSGGSFAGSFWASRGRFKAKVRNPSPRTESASVLRIERWSSCQHTAWRVVLGSLIKEARDVSVHAFVYRFCCITLSRAPSSTQSASQSSLAPHSSKSHWVTIAHHFHTLRVHSLCYLIHFLICF